MLEEWTGKWVRVVQKTRPMLEGEITDQNEAGIVIHTSEDVDVFISISSIVEVTHINAPE